MSVKRYKLKSVFVPPNAEFEIKRIVIVSQLGLLMRPYASKSENNQNCFLFAQKIYIRIVFASCKNLRAVRELQLPPYGGSAGGLVVGSSAYVTSCRHCTGNLVQCAYKRLLLLHY